MITSDILALVKPAGVSCEPCSGGELQLDRFQKPAHLEGPQAPQGHLALAGDEGDAADGGVHLVMM